MSSENQNPTVFAIFFITLILSLIGISSACPTGCVCRGPPEERTAAICYKPWRGRGNQVRFIEPITSLEFRNLLYADIRPYLQGARGATVVVIYPSKRAPEDNPLPQGLFEGMDQLQDLTIHRTINREAPVGLAMALRPVTGLQSLDLVGNSLTCDCSIPDALASHGALLLGKNRMPPVRDCRSNGFEKDLYSVGTLLQECATLGSYTTPQEATGTSEDRSLVANPFYSNRQFGNVNNRQSFDNRVQFGRINSNPNRPRNRPAIPRRAFGGALMNGEIITRDFGDTDIIMPSGPPPDELEEEEDVEEVERGPSAALLDILRNAQQSRRTGRTGRSVRRLLEVGDSDLQSRDNSNDTHAISSETDTDNEGHEIEAVPLALSSRDDEHNGHGHHDPQLALYKLPNDDLTIRLNPFDPFEIDLFFKYILHEEGMTVDTDDTLYP